MLTIVERHPGRVLASLGLLFVSMYVAAVLSSSSRRIVQGDAIHYYVYLRSVVFDGDVQFQNDYIRLYGLRGGEPGVEWVFNRLPTGYVRNLMPIGPAIVWAPLYLLTCALVWIANALGASYPLDGYGRLFQVSAGVSGAVAAVVGVWMAFATARRWYGDRPAIWAALAMWLGSSAWYYSLVSPTYSHAASMLAAGTFIWVWARPDRPITPRRYFWLGVLGGFATLVRWQDGIFLLAPIGDAAWHIAGGSTPRRERVRDALVSLGVLAIATVVVLSPQMVVWQVLYGRPLTVPQGSEFMRWESPALLEVLFSTNHGLFSWTPIVLPAIAGLVLLANRNLRVGVLVSAVLIGSWFVNAAVADWWAGEAFGARRFVSCFPIFVLGLTAIFDRVRERLGLIAGVTALAVGLNALLLFQYQVFMKGWRDIAPYPDGRNLWVARFVVPWRVLQRLLGS